MIDSPLAHDFVDLGDDDPADAGPAPVRGARRCSVCDEHGHNSRGCPLARATRRAERDQLLRLRAAALGLVKHVEPD